MDNLSASRAIVLLSGGQDSVTALYWAKQTFPEVSALSFDYGQRHHREIEAAATVAMMSGVNHTVLPIRAILRSTSPLVNPDVAVEAYPDAAALPGGLEKTFVPGRNALFLTLAANWAYAERAGNIVIGVSGEDQEGYPDCRPQFIKAMEWTLELALSTVIRIHTPLIYLSKQGTVELAAHLGSPCWDALAYSHTCYNGTLIPCGHCHACLLRAKGFAEARRSDPLLDRLTDAGAELPD